MNETFYNIWQHIISHRDKSILLLLYLDIYDRHWIKLEYRWKWNKNMQYRKILDAIYGSATVRDGPRSGKYEFPQAMVATRDCS